MAIEREIKGKRHRLVVLRVHEWDAAGRPSKVEIGYDETLFDLRDDAVSREFITTFVPVEATQPKIKEGRKH